MSGVAREPAVAGMFYPAGAAGLHQMSLGGGVPEYAVAPQAAPCLSARWIPSLRQPSALRQ